MNKLLSQIRFFLQVFLQSFFRMKLMVLLILQIFAFHIYLSPIINFSKIAKCPVTPWFLPFLLSNPHFGIVYMAGVIYYYSNVPFMQYSQMYPLIRAGRTKWAIGQIVSIILSGFGLAFAAVVLSILPLLSNIQFETGWGKVIYSLALTNAKNDYGIILNFPYNIINAYNPFEAMGTIFLVSALVFALIGIIMFVVSIYISRIIAISTAMVFIIMQLVIRNLLNFIKTDFLIYGTPAAWVDINMIGIKYSDNLPSLPYIISVLLGMLFLLSGLIIYKIRSIDFQWCREE